MLLQTSPTWYFQTSPTCNHIDLDRRVTEAHRQARYERLQRQRRGGGNANVLLDDAARDRLKQANLAVDKKDRFRRLQHVGVIIGCTNENAPRLPGDIAYLLCDNSLNYTYRDSRSVMLADSAIDFKESFYLDIERRKAHRQREQSNALCTLEQREVISTAEAIMVAHHQGAWKVALRIAKTNNIYQDREVPALPANEFRPAAAVAIMNNFNATYETDISREVIAHACAFYGAYYNQFPPEFRVADHLDFFVWWYDGQIFIRRHEKPELDDTLGVLGRDETIDLLGHALANAVEVARFDQHIIQFANLPLLRHLSPIAAKDALPDQLRRAEHDDIVRVLDRLGYNVREELDMGFAVQRNNPLPSDFSHMDEWFPFFFGHQDNSPTLPHNRTPRVGVNMRHTMLDGDRHGQIPGLLTRLSNCPLQHGRFKSLFIDAEHGGKSAMTLIGNTLSLPHPEVTCSRMALCMWVLLR